MTSILNNNNNDNNDNNDNNPPPPTRIYVAITPANPATQNLKQWTLFLDAPYENQKTIFYARLSATRLKDENENTHVLTYRTKVCNARNMEGLIELFYMCTIYSPSITAHFYNDDNNNNTTEGNGEGGNNNNKYNLTPKTVFAPFPSATISNMISKIDKAAQKMIEHFNRDKSCEYNNQDFVQAVLAAMGRDSVVVDGEDEGFREGLVGLYERREE